VFKTVEDMRKRNTYDSDFDDFDKWHSARCQPIPTEELTVATAGDESHD